MHHTKFVGAGLLAMASSTPPPDLKASRQQAGSYRVLLPIAIQGDFDETFLA
jgi:hypothetical protein